MMMAAGQGMKVSKPFGDSGRYDVGVERPVRENGDRRSRSYSGKRRYHESRYQENRFLENSGRVLRVQVKSTIYKRRNGEYSLNVMGPRRKKYAPGTVDFFAVLLIPIDDWYIIPFESYGEEE